jgi:predicted nucleic acid-binding protein
MGRISTRLASISIVGLDTSIFIYHFEAHPDYLPFTTEVLDGIESGRWAGVTSTITLMELAVRPWQLGRGDVARKYEALLVNFPHLTIVDVDRQIARHAAELRASFGLRPADAIQVAACLVHGAQAFVTNDHRLAKLQPLFPIVLLE